MILVFGGTTEGRVAAKVLDEAGSLYYYSTRGHTQDIQLAHGVRLIGTMEPAEMKDFCIEHNIILIIDASHPFAENLHQNIVNVAHQISLPVLRYNRIFPPHNSDIVWCQDYNDAISRLSQHKIKSLLALTGVNTIGKLKKYWEQNECWFRILNRDDSHELAARTGFPCDHLVYYETDDTSKLLKQLRPDAIITKESGLSGGYVDKVNAAREKGTQIFVVERPPYPSINGLSIEHVNGPHGLRRAVEKLFPDFYPLHSGLTTGTCATAAAVAATMRLIKTEMPSFVPVILPNGETINVAVTYGKGYASVFKESGDDPDVTDGIEIRAYVEHSDKFEILGGDGVGTFTYPGFDYPPGEPAINKVPREMMRKNITENVRITISIPKGAEIARRTFNPRLGIEGGISVIGVSGIVKPFSEKAFIDSIRKCMQVAVASGTEQVIIYSGGMSERFIMTRYPHLPRQSFVEYGNYIGETLKIADELNVGRVTLGVMLGKAVKLAAGNLDTHSRHSTMDKAFIRSMLHEAGCDINIDGISLARELWDIIPKESLQSFADVVRNHCMRHCACLLPDGELTILIIANNGTIYD